MFRYLIILSKFLGVCLIGLASCAPTEETTYSYKEDFQVVSVNSPILQASNESLTYSNDDLALTYNLWQEGGKMAYTIQNKSDQIIFIDLKRTFFIKNGRANDYYTDKKTTVTEKSSQSNEEFYSTFGVEEVSYSESSSESVEIASKARIAIPPQSHKKLFRFTLTSSIFEFCDLSQELSTFGESSHTKVFERKSSPMTFKNYLKYSFDKDLETAKTISHEFWVSKVQNVEHKDFFDQREVQTGCDSTKTKEITVSPHKAGFKFYNAYEAW